MYAWTALIYIYIYMTGKLPAVAYICPHQNKTLYGDNAEPKYCRRSSLPNPEARNPGLIYSLACCRLGFCWRCVGPERSDVITGIGTVAIGQSIVPSSTRHGCRRFTTTRSWASHICIGGFGAEGFKISPDLATANG